MGGWLDFYLQRGPTLFGSPKPYEEALFACYGVPFDSTSWFRPGSRFGPLSIRVASQGLENPYNRISLADLGDLPPSVNVAANLRRVFRVVKQIVKDGKIPVGIGGEHTLTLAAFKAACTDCGLIVLDAHLDMRDDFMDSRLNHATWLRRLTEKGFGERILVIGARGFEMKELEYAEQNGVKALLCNELEKADKTVKEFLDKFDRIYLSIDMDVLDPSSAPGVSSPEPLGMSPNLLHRVLEMILSSARLVGVDVVEVNPLFDNGLTSIHAASLLLKIFTTISSQV